MAESPVLLALYAAVDAVNEQLPAGDRLARTGAAKISGDDAQLDSMGLVSFLLAAEQQLQGVLGGPVRLVEALVGDESGAIPETLLELAEVVSRRHGGSDGSGAP
jgi:hypothetical protein